MSKNNPNLCTFAQAMKAESAINQAVTEGFNIGGGVKSIFDSQDPVVMQARGELVGPFGSTVDSDEPDAKMYTLELNSGAKLNACMCFDRICSKIQGPDVWKKQLEIDAAENTPKAEG